MPKAEVVEDVTGRVLDVARTIEAIPTIVNYHLSDTTEQKGLVSRSETGITTLNGATIRLYVVPLIPPFPVP